MEGRCGFSEGFPEGKTEGWNGQGPMQKEWGEAPFHPEDFPEGNP